MLNSARSLMLHIPATTALDITLGLTDLIAAAPFTLAGDIVDRSVDMIVGTIDGVVHGATIPASITATVPIITVAITIPSPVVPAASIPSLSAPCPTHGPVQQVG